MVFAQEIKTSIAIFFNGYKNKDFLVENTYTYKDFPQNPPPFQEFFIPLHLVGEKCTY